MRSTSRFVRLTLVGLLAAGAGLLHAQDIKIANIVELSGAGTTSGTMFKNGVEMAIKEINAAGGIQGKKISFTTEDTQTNPGVAKGLTQKAIPPGETYTYEFTFSKPGTFMYHPHFDEMTQIALGMVGMIVVHPRRGRRPDRDYAILLHEWDIPAGARRPNPLAMSDFNVLTMNSRAYPGTDPLVAEVGDRVRIRFGNLGPMDHHPIHIHGHAFAVVETDGGPVPPSARWPETAILVPVGTVRAVELRAEAPGDWPLHCHMTHHVMNQMGHDTPNLVGADVADADRRIRKLVPGYMAMGQTGMGSMAGMGHAVPANSVPMKGAPGPFGTIDMGGMFTIVKIRERLTGDPGWYAHPPGTVAQAASKDQLARDGIEVE